MKTFNPKPEAPLTVRQFQDVVALIWLLLAVSLAMPAPSLAAPISCGDLGTRIKEAIDKKSAERQRPSATTDSGAKADASKGLALQKSGGIAQALAALKLSFRNSIIGAAAMARRWVETLAHFFPDNRQTYPVEYRATTEAYMNGRFAKKKWFEALSVKHPTALFMQKLGVVFDVEHDIIRVPPTETLFTNLKKAMADAGHANDLRPARMFQNEKGEIFPVLLGEAPPPSSRPLMTLLSTLRFSDMIAHGYFPIGGWESITEHSNIILHDLAHLATFAAYPEYAAGFIEAHRNIHEKLEEYTAANGGNQTKGDGIERFDPFKDAFGLDTPLSERHFFVTEALGLIPPEHVAKFNLLLPPVQSPGDHYTLTQVRTFLEQQRLAPEEVRERLADIYKKIQIYEARLGGTAADLFSTRSFTSNNPIHKHYSETLDGLATRVERLLNKRILSQTGATEDPVALLARLQVMIVESSRLQPGEAVKDGLAAFPKEGTAIQHFITKTGLFSDFSPYPRAFSGIRPERLALPNGRTVPLYPDSTAHWLDKYRPTTIQSVSAERVGAPVVEGENRLHFEIRSEDGKSWTRFYPIADDPVWRERGRKMMAADSIAENLIGRVKPPAKLENLKLGDRPATLGLTLAASEQPLGPAAAADLAIVDYLVTGEADTAMLLGGLEPSDHLIARLRAKLPNDGLFDHAADLLGKGERDAVLKRVAEILDRPEQLARARLEEQDAAFVDATFDEFKPVGLTREQLADDWEVAKRSGLDADDFKRSVRAALDRKNEDAKTGCSVK